MPRDVLARIEELTKKFGNPDIRFEKCDRNLAEFENTYSDGWVEVFVLFNNEDGAHYFWKEQKEDSQMKEFKKSTAFSSNKEIKKHTHSIEPGGESLEWQPINSEEELHLAAKNGGSYYLAEDIELTEELYIIADMNLCLNDKVLKQTADRSRAIRINENIHFNLCDCSGENGTTRYWDRVKDGLWNDLWTLKTDDSISDYITVGGVITGGGVYNEGTFNIYGGSITGNRGGVSNSGTFVMHGGSITGNSAFKGGGVDNYCTFNMYGGSITGNSADYGGGMYHESNAKFAMNGGNITGNSAKNSGGGVYNAGKFTMNGGSITGNSADYGGGVYNNHAFTLHDGKITSNTANEGGDVYNKVRTRRNHRQ